MYTPGAMEGVGVRLLCSTGDQKVDEILRGTIGLFEAAVPGGVAGYYLAGSYANGTAVSTSDIDFFYDLRVPAAELTPEEAHRCLAVASLVDLISPIEIHPGLVHAPVDWVVMRQGTHLYGDDRRSQMPSPTVDELLRWVLRRHPRLGLRGSGVGRERSARYPLEYPDPADEFFGYTGATVRTRDGRVHAGTHGLVNLITGAATMRVAMEKGVVVPSKGVCAALYREHVGDVWSELVEEAYEWCRNRWEYLIPASDAARHRLRTLCRRTLELENHHLLVRRTYLRRLLADGDEANRAFAAEALAVIGFPSQWDHGLPPSATHSVT